jgi:REP element-mobilizing transposase RayT
MNKMEDKFKYKPHLHHRRSIRLKGFDYSKAGLYFIAICCQDRISRFGNIENSKMILNQFGEVAFNEWVKLTERFINFQIDEFQIMPNHIHGIILLNDFPNVGAGFTPAQPPSFDNSAQHPSFDNSAQHPSFDNSAQPQSFDNPVINSNCENSTLRDIRATGLMDNGATARVAPTVGNIIGAYKSLVTNGCLNIYKLNNKTMGKLWQRNYYEHIIRNEKSYQTIANYIINNPSNWENDKFFKK